MTKEQEYKGPKYMVIVLNGPPRCGKDTLAERLSGNRPFMKIGQHQVTCWHEKISLPMKVAIQAFFDISEYDLEMNKDNSNFLPNKRSGRQALISLSETWAKPMFGKDIFGKMAAKDVSRTLGRIPLDNCIHLFVFSDGGFEEEFKALCKHHKPNVGILRMVRAGCSFNDDSRSYIKNFPDKTSFALLDNNASIAELERKFIKIVNGWLDERYG